MKKIIALVLAVMMVLSLAACGGSSAPAAETQKTDAPAANTGSETPKEVYHVKLEMASLMTVPNLEATTRWSRGRDMKRATNMMERGTEETPKYGERAKSRISTATISTTGFSESFLYSPQPSLTTATPKREERRNTETAIREKTDLGGRFSSPKERRARLYPRRP